MNIHCEQGPVPVSGIAFEAIIYKISSTADGGYRLTLELGSNETEAIQGLIKELQKPCQVAIISKIPYFKPPAEKTDLTIDAQDLEVHSVFTGVNSFGELIDG
jgi:hypothetical protein